MANDRDEDSVDILQSCPAYGSMDRELLTAYKIISSFQQAHVCAVCPHNRDKHDMNCIECCPFKRAVDAVTPKPAMKLHKPSKKCPTCKKVLGKNPFTTMWNGRPKKFCSGECFTKYNAQDSNSE